MTAFKGFQFEYQLEQTFIQNCANDFVKILFIFNHCDPKQKRQAGFIFCKMTGSQIYFWIKILFLKINLDIAELIKVSFIHFCAIKIYLIIRFTRLPCLISVKLF